MPVKRKITEPDGVYFIALSLAKGHLSSMAAFN